MTTVTIICITIVILAIIGLIAYFLYLKQSERERLDNLKLNEPKDNRIYLDRLQILQRRYEHISIFEFEDDETVPQELRDLLRLIDALTNKLY